MNPGLRSSRWLFVPAVLLFCYWPALTVEYGVHNDYSVWSYDKSTIIFDYPESAHLAAIGRPLGAVLLNLQLLPIHSISDFTTARWFTLLVILLSALLLARQLRRVAKLPAGFAACAAMCVFLLPSSQVFLFWVGNFVPGSLNVLIALLTYEVLDKVELSGWRGGAWRRTKVIAWLLLAGLLFLASMCIYPPTTLFILVPAFSCLVFSPLEMWPQTRRRLVRDMVFTIVGVSGYFVLMQYVIRPVMGQHFPDIQGAIDWNQAGIYQVAVEANGFVWLEKLSAILRVSLDGCLHPLLGESASTNVAIALASGLLLAAVGWFLRRPTTPGAAASRVQRGYFLQACVAGLALLALSQCPVIVAKGTGGFVSYRVLYPASAMMILLLFSIVGRLRFASRVPQWVATPLPAMILIGCAILGHDNLRSAAANAHTELAHAREQLRSLDLHAAKGVQVIGPVDAANFVSGPLREEFKTSATRRSFVPGFVDALLAEKGIRRGQLMVRHVCPSSTDEYLMMLPGMAVIDMNGALPASQIGRSQQPRALATASAEGMNVGNRLSAFDRDPRSFWEAGGLPQWIQTDYGRPFELAEYSLGATLPPERTPLEWELLGSNDGSHWTLVDRRRGESVWAQNEARTFSLAAPVRFCAYRLVLTAGRADIVRVGEWCLRHERAARIATHANSLTR